MTSKYSLMNGDCDTLSGFISSLELIICYDDERKVELFTDLQSDIVFDHSLSSLLYIKD
jgi:hypothetical protein